MKLILFLFLLSLPVFAAFTEKDRNYIRQLAKDHCQTRQGLYAILFDKEKPLAKVFCKNGESIVFYLKK